MAARWRELIYTLQPTTQTLTIEVPKFRLETTRKLNADLIALGITLTAAKPALIISRPFVFAIRERFSGTLLFPGKVVRPVAP